MTYRILHAKYMFYRRWYLSEPGTWALTKTGVQIIMKMVRYGIEIEAIQKQKADVQ